MYVASRLLEVIIIIIIIIIIIKKIIIIIIINKIFSQEATLPSGGFQVVFMKFF